MKLKKIIFTVLSTAVFASCNKITDKFDNSLNNPNSVSPDLANSRLLLANAELAFASFFNGTSDIGMQVTRQVEMFGPKYSNAYSAQTFDGLWTTAYASIFKNINAMLPLAQKEQKWTDMGIAKTIKAYTLLTLVDFFGDVPLAEANLGADNTNPKADKGSDVYAAAIKLLDEAIAHFNNTTNLSSSPGASDLFFGTTGSTGRGRWIALANTLKMKAYLNTRLIDAATAKTKIDALLTGTYVNSLTGDFEFKYSNKQANPNSRHPRYNSNYNGDGSSSGEASDYMGIYFMWTMLAEKTETPGARGRTSTAAGALDPRLRYYFYRQRTSLGSFDQTSLSCIDQTPPIHYTFDMPFCYLNNGYTGRDHGDNSGTPPDGNLKTTVGIYPNGGEFDNNQKTRVALNRGGLGAGIEPIWPSSFTSFLKAEAALKLGTAGSPRALLEEGVRRSITKVQAYPTSVGFILPTTNPDILMNTPAKIDNYVIKVLTLYDAALTDEARLEVIAKEWYIASWGNGVESYNMYRRTMHPANMQFARTSSPGTFIYSMLYPSVYVNLNINAAQKAGVDKQVFWDNNPKTLR